MTAGIPSAWYNILADLPFAVPKELPPPQVANGPRIGPQVPMELIRQSASKRREIPVPDVVGQAYESWRPTPLRRALVWLMDRAFSAPPCKVDRALQDGDVVEALGGLRVVHAPGHTPGNIALYEPQRQILFCGDSIFNGAPFSRKQGIQAPPRLFSVDAEQARRSFQALAELPIKAICFGHGEPIVDQAQEKLREAVKAAQD